MNGALTKADLQAVRDEIAERVEEAWDTLRRVPDPEAALLHHRGQRWPAMIHTAAEHAAWKPSRTRRPPPTNKQIDRMHEVLGWLLALAKQDADFCKAVWVCCAMNMGPSEAAKRIGAHRETVRVWRDNGLDRISQIRTRLRTI